MKSKSLVLIALLLSSGQVLAQYAYDLPPVVVRATPATPVYPDGEAALSFNCGALYQARPADVEQLLQINDRSQTQHLSNKLLDAVSEACKAGVPMIVVERGKSGRSVTWRAAHPYEMGIALY